MCGIIGSWQSKTKGNLSPSWVEGAIDNLAHRGPEGKNIENGPHFVFGHRLLSFHNRQSAYQPYRSNDGRFIISFNGEIYNYEDLRQELIVSGLLLTTNSECELIAKLYGHYGGDAFKRLRGMFAIALADLASDELTLVRDYIGKKPLFYLRRGDEVHFASEASPLYRLLKDRRVDTTTLIAYFFNNAPPADQAMISGIEKVAPGEIVTFMSVRGVQRTRYWHPEQLPLSSSQPLEKHVEELETLLSRAVSRRLKFEGDELGLLYSGGLDSSLIAALISEQNKELRSITAFTALFGTDPFEDEKYAQLQLQKQGLEHVFLRMKSQDVVESAETYISLLDEPIADPSLLAIASITRKAKGQFKAFMTGDGADDVFLGYEFYRALRLLRMAEQFGLDGVARRIHDSRLLPSLTRDMNWSQVAKMLLRAIGWSDRQKFAAATSAFTPHELERITIRDIEVQNAQESESFEGYRAVQSGMISSMLQDRILSKLDRGSMLNAIELRCPFLDQDVVDYSLSLPVDHLILRGETKRIIRRLAKRRVHPDIINRRKRGFRLPLNELLRGPLREQLIDTLSARNLFLGGVFRPEPVLFLVNQHMSGKADLSKKLWALFCFQTWQNKWGVESVG